MFVYVCKRERKKTEREREGDRKTDRQRQTVRKTDRKGQEDDKNIK